MSLSKLINSILKVIRHILRFILILLIIIYKWYVYVIDTVFESYMLFNLIYNKNHLHFKKSYAKLNIAQKNYCIFYYFNNISF